MNVLHITPYITSKQHPAFLRNQTGFGYMVHDIAKLVGKFDEVDLFAAMCFTPSMKMEGFNVVGRSWWNLLCSFSLKSLFDGFSFLKKYPLPLKERLRTLYVFLSIGVLNKTVRYYDIVHIHGCSPLTDAAIRVCKRNGVPFMVTLHGLNSFSDEIKLHPSLRQYERDFIMEAATKHHPVSFISSGNKQMAEESAGMMAESFHVVCNGCDVTPHKVSFDVRSAYGIKKDDFVFAFVGNISQNKNQYQVARAWNLLPEEVKHRCKVLFVGRYNEDDEVVRYIHKNGFQDHLILCGMQPKDKVASYYQSADATILTSITEGFGLSIIEGYVYGKPNVTFADLPATQDLYDECAMVAAKNRTDAALAEAMIKVINATFDKNKIIKHARLFSFERMADKYHELYNQIVK